jgi:hypothetical protein
MIKNVNNFKVVDFGKDPSSIITSSVKCEITQRLGLAIYENPIGAIPLGTKISGNEGRNLYDISSNGVVLTFTTKKDIDMLINRLVEIRG